ncbi:sporulation protein [Ectobacillus ponti]|uniref:Sporulation protein n=1 Tax=Ectobacillus ponti TaxID=2961894 RepID=A0AA42BSG3_9BACI|nr:sporulation protein [Ectobacillus ponti]MCP8968413.1 sporulation protein [Ectobacillus ponti]
MLKKFLARFGKGAATVDLRFENRPYAADETVRGQVVIQGGEVEQRINHLAVRLMMSLGTKQGTVTREVQVIPLSGAFSILPQEQKTIPFTYTVPADLPVSRGTVSYYFDTHLDIEGGVDRTDVDRLVVEVPEEIRPVFAALGHLGFHEKPTSGKVDRYGQEFAFVPTTAFAGRVEEIELRFARDGHDVFVWMEVDCRHGYHEVEAQREFKLESGVLQSEAETARVLEQYIGEAVERPHAYAQPLSYKSHHTHSLLGGLAAGIMGAVLLDEVLDVLDVLDVDDAFEGGEDGGFGDFFGGDDDV